MRVSLEVAKINDRASSEFIPEINVLGKNLEEYNVSYSSMLGARRMNRKTMGENLKQDYVTNCPQKIHWDGQLIGDITGHENVGRL